MYRDRTVAVAVPAYNEEGYVGSVIRSLPTYIDRVYVVDDGSTDGTWEEIRRAASTRNETYDDGPFEDLVVPIRHRENRGVGGAIKTAYRKALAEDIDITAVLAGDGQMDVDELPRYLDPIVDGKADYTKGNRFASVEDRAVIPRFRLVGNTVLSYLTRVASGYWGSMDSQNGYTAISNEALERTDIDGMYEYYGYCNDLLVRLNVADLRIADVPQSAVFVYGGDWKSHIRYSEYIPRVSVLLLRAFLRRLWQKHLRDGPHPLAVLYLFGLGLVGANTTGLLASLGDTDRTERWGLGLALGLLVFLAGTALDRVENRELERHIETGERSESGERTRETGDATRSAER